MITLKNRWLPVVGYEGFYEVSDAGEVRSLDRVSCGRKHKGKILSPWKHRGGHRIVSLRKAGSEKKLYVHRLVLEAFTGPPNNDQEARHIDDDPGNNNLSNLKWGSRSENMLDRSRNGIHASVSLSKRVKRSDGQMFESLKQAAESVNGFKTNVSQVCRGYRKSYKGFGWEYV